MVRTIIHIDLNSCFAACEQQDNLAWRYKPVAVVQDSGKRSVIIASSVEAKSYGVKTGTKVWEAKGLCPQLIVTPARFDRYVFYSREFRKICKLYSNQIEVFSIDELFIDVTETAHLFGGAENIALLLKHRLKTEVGDYLTCSVGIAPNKMLAKLASGSKKPDGLVIVAPQEKITFLDSHPLWHICGIGDRIVKRLNAMGVYTISQLRSVPLHLLTKEFGIMGAVYHQWSWGEDSGEVSNVGLRQPDKSYGNQLTLPQDISFQESLPVLLWLSWQVGFRMRKHAVCASTVSLCVRGGSLSGFAQKTVRSCFDPLDIYRTTISIYEKKFRSQYRLRFIGVSVSGLTSTSSHSLPLLPGLVKWQKIFEACDTLSTKYDPFCVHPARLLSTSIRKSEFNGFSKKF